MSVGATIVKRPENMAGLWLGSIKGDEHCIDVGCKVIEGHCVERFMQKLMQYFNVQKFGVCTERCNYLYYTFSMFKLYQINNTSWHKGKYAMLMITEIIDMLRSY